MTARKPAAAKPAAKKPAAKKPAAKRKPAAKKKPAARKPPPKKPPATPAEGKRDAANCVLAPRVRVISVFGPFGSKALIEMPTELASEMFDRPLEAAGRTNAIDAVERDLEAIRDVAPKIADSGIAATAVRMAYELENPYTSATAKSMCARSLIQAIDRLLELAPDEGGEDGLDALAARITARREGKPAPSD